VTPYSSIPIGEILPQQPPFRFVDSFENYTEDGAVVAFTPQRGKQLLMEDGHLSAAGLVEHMAQASAARVGYVSKYILHIPVSIGFIGQVRKLIINRLPREGERIETEVLIRQEVFKITLADIVVRSGSEVLASASLKSALPE